MTTYKHTQISYLMLLVLLALLILFAWFYSTASAEPPSVDSGPNAVVTAFMVLIPLILGSFSWLTVTVDKDDVKIKFGWGIFRKRFPLQEIASVASVKNPWYVGWGIRLWLWPYMWIYNVSGFDAVEIVLKNGKRYRIGTDAPKDREAAIRQGIDFHSKGSVTNKNV